MNQNKSIPIRFKPEEFEVKWQEKWEEAGTYQNDMKSAQKPYYNLMMFPYPSAEGLHVGNMYAFTGVDIHGRFMRMQGFDVFEPIGLDGFGIHSENYAMKVGRKPQEHAIISEKNFYRQLRSIGNGYDWTRTVETYDAEYYRWTQWLFVQMFKHGLAYRAKAQVNWCPGCKTVLADEQVIDGKCERCNSIVEKKELEQWFFRITAYAERLLQNTYKPQFNWPEKIKLGQRNWIGKKEGINISYQLSDDSLQQLGTTKKIQIEVFTTAPVNFGMTFLVVSPEYDLVKKILGKEIQIPIERYKEVEKYVVQALKKTDDERKAQGREKTGVFTGLTVINPVNKKEVPVWISDFVVKGVGTGAVQGCPGHDYKDFEFAQKFGIPIVRVVVGADGDTSDIDSIDKVIVSGMKGTMVNSEFLNGLEFSAGLQATMDYFEEKGWGKRVVTYHLRDWLISRQRYWGAPIPMIYCESCAKAKKSWFDTNKSIEVSFPRKRESIQIDPRVKPEDDNSWAVGWFPVSEDQLPVTLPEVEDWRPTGTGRGPLAGHPEFYNTTCPQCGSAAVRETDVCDTFLDSSWYYLRYPNVSRHSERSEESSSAKQNASLDPSAAPQDDKALPWDPEITRKWFPIDSYIGGAEHTVLHLLYTRFTWMALKDWGFLQLTADSSQLTAQNYDSDEPFKRFFAHGLIIKDGAKMSKSKGNVVVPDEYIKLYGSDALRTYLMFLGPFEAGGDFRDTGMQGMYRWLARVWRLVHEAAILESKKSITTSIDAQKLISKTIKFATEQIRGLHYNTAIAKYMEFVNWWMERPQEVGIDTVKDFLKLLAPFAPHMTEELWNKLTADSSQLTATFKSIHKELWPTYDEKLLVEDAITIVVQVNGKMRDSLVVSIQDANQQSLVEQKAKECANVDKWLGDNKIRKVIFIPGKLVNFVI